MHNVESRNNAGAMGLPPRNYSRKNAAGKVATQGTTAPPGTWTLGDRLIDASNDITTTLNAWANDVAGEDRSGAGAGVEACAMADASTPWCHSPST